MATSELLTSHTTPCEFPSPEGGREIVLSHKLDHVSELAGIYRAVRVGTYNVFDVLAASD